MTLADLIPTETKADLNEGNAIVIKSIMRNISFVQGHVTYNRKQIFARARKYNRSGMTWAESLKLSWAESKKVVLRGRKEMASLKLQLNSFYTPKQYHETSEYKNMMIEESMINAYNNGINLNK